MGYQPQPGYSAQPHGTPQPEPTPPHQQHGHLNQSQPNCSHHTSSNLPPHHYQQQPLPHFHPQTYAAQPGVWPSQPWPVTSQHPQPTQPQQPHSHAQPHHSQRSPQHQSYPQYPSPSSTQLANAQAPPSPLHSAPAGAAAEDHYRQQLAGYRRKLAEYYYSFAINGHIAPADGDEQLNARAVAIEWARGQGVSVAGPTAGPVPPPRRATLPPAPGQPSAQSHHLPYQPPPQPVSYPAAPPSIHPIPPPPRTGSAPIRPPSAPNVPTRPLSTGIDPSPAHALPTSPTNDFSGTPGGKRPLPVPPLRARPSLPAIPSSPAPKPSLPAIVVPGGASTQLDQLAGRVAVVHISTVLAATRTDSPAPNAAPPIPSFSFDCPEQQPGSPTTADSSGPNTPTITFSVDEPDSSNTELPGSSFSQPQPVTVPVKASHPPPRTQPLPHPPKHPHPHSQPTQPPLHPRDDPSHPSHALYHPAARLPALRGEGVESGLVKCRGCGEALFGRVITSMGQSWHPKCFVCMHDGCSIALEHVQFDGKDGQVYCMVHYEERYALTCHQCKTPISEADYLTLADPALPPVPRYYHALHFFCAECGDPFVDPSSLSKGEQHTVAKPYMVSKGFAFCENCEVKMFMHKCHACGEGIGGDYTEAGGVVYHPECFNCTDCMLPLTGHYVLRIPEDDEVPAESSPFAPPLLRPKLKSRVKKGVKEEKAYCHACAERRALEAADASVRAAYPSAS